MRHGIKGRKFCRTSSHRLAMFANMASSLIECEQITTTLAKAKDLRPFVERTVTLAKGGSLHERRQALATLRDQDAVKKLFDTLSERYKDRAGGYTRIMKAGFRAGDNTPMAIIEFVDRDPSAKVSGKVFVESDEDAELKAA